MSGSRVCGLCLAALAMACSRPTAEPVGIGADVEAIHALREREAQLVASGNPDSMLTVYTGDVRFLPAGEPMVEGRANAKRWAEATFAQFTLTPKYTSSSVLVSGDIAVDRYTGTLTMTPKAGGAATIEQIKGIHVLRKGTDGTWKIAQDIWNSDTPAAPSSSPAARP